MKKYIYVLCAVLMGVFASCSKSEMGDATPDHNLQFTNVKVGDFYYKNGDWSSTYVFDANNPCIGIVFVVNADGMTGKIVGLTEPEANWNGVGSSAHCLYWGPYQQWTNANDEEDGETNMMTIKGMPSWQTSYPAFAWAESLNTPAIAGIKWYLPALKELRQLYAAMSGLKWVASGAGAGEVNDWSFTMPGEYRSTDARTAFNGKFTTAQGTPIDLTNCRKSYLSSTEKDLYYAWCVHFCQGITTSLTNKMGDCYVRAISAF